MTIREATTQDWNAIWPIFQEVVASGDTYAYETDTTKEQAVAVELGYQAMQFNFVASSNVGAVRLWSKLGFETVGRLPKAFNHPTQGFVDALVMFKWLGKAL